MSAAPAAPGRNDRANILIVDDLPEKLMVFQTILEDLGQNLVIARSGSEALSQVLQREFAVILLDVNMPDIDGLETAGFIRQYKKSAHTPIIFVTAYADEMQTAKGYSLGAVDYILSPIQPEILRSKVRVFVELFRLQQQTRMLAEERVALEQAEAARRAAEEANRLKDEFIAVLSHELRNPLAPIRAAVEVMRRIAPPDPKLALAGNMMERQVAHLVRLVDELLDVARMGRGRIVLKREQLELDRVIAHGVEPVRALIESRRQTLAVSVPPVPVWISGDPVRLGQVISNLVSNAAKFTREGGRIQVDATASRGQALICVRDTGVGIEPELLPRIFDLFVQGERSLDRSQGGMGIGLTLARHLVELHQGRIEAHSSGPGKGAMFKVFLPCISAVEDRPAPVPAPEVAAVPQRRVLVVDDNADAAESIAMVLRLSGHDVKVLTDAHHVLSSARVFAPQVAVLDIGLPGVDGHQLARQLRQQEGNDALVLIALTGYGQPQDRERSTAAGFDYHFVKPVEPRDIEAAIVGERRAPEAKAPAGKHPARSSK
jgi:signal transduction histidine kinase